MLTQEYLKSVLDYNPDTGVFIWTKPVARAVKVGDIAGCYTGTYHLMSIKNKSYRGHKIAWIYMTGETPKASIDHINQDKKDNRWCNLRLASKAQNAWNTGISKANNSGYKGVSFIKARNKWIAQIQAEGKYLFLGYFNCPKLAHEAYIEASLRLHEEFSNFI